VFSGENVVKATLCMLYWRFRKLLASSNSTCSTSQSASLRLFGESLQIRAGARDLRSRMGLENVSRALNRKNPAKPICASLRPISDCNSKFRSCLRY
jgi:hypothetical protein